MPTPKHVLIVGGGLAGPCLARSLAKHNIRSTIFEIRDHRSDSGGSISQGPNALQVLDRFAGVYDQVKANGYVYSRFGAYADDGEKFGEIKAGFAEPEDLDQPKEGAEGAVTNYPAVRIMRSTLHNVLLDACEDGSGLVDIKYGVNLQRIEEDDGGVTAFFEDGNQVRGDILIGADGTRSKVREHILGAESPIPIFDNVMIVSGFLPRSKAITPSHDVKFPLFAFTPIGFIMTIPIDPKGETLAWGINKPSPERSREEWKELETSGEGAKLAKSDYTNITSQPLRSLLDNADDTKARIWAPYSIPDITTWHTKRVCLVGDAAHAMSPNGQGSALAFEDVAILTRLITHPKAEELSYETIFAKYQELRQPRVRAIRKTTKAVRSGTTPTESGPWIWWAKKWAFRAYFWWNSGVLKHVGETSYDVEKVDLGL